MVRIAEQRILERARFESRVFCGRVIPQHEWTDKAGTTHVSGGGPCNGRMKPVRAHGVVLQDVVECRFCGTRAVLRSPAPAVPELQICATCGHEGGLHTSTREDGLPCDAIHEGQKCGCLGFKVAEHPTSDTETGARDTVDPA